MTILWGPWSSNNRLRAGVEVVQSPATVTGATVSVTLTTKDYLQTRYASNEFGGSNTWFITGTVVNGSGNTDWDLPDMGYKLMGQTVTTVTLTYGATQTRTATARIHSYFAYPGTDVSVSTTVTIPARPVSVPAAPSAFTATRNSDVQVTLGWTRNATTGAPYTSQVIERAIYTGSTWSAYSVLASVSGTATSYVNTTTSANHVYQYRIKSVNSSGSSAYVYSGYIFMTPAAPSGVSSSVDPGGAAITTSWTRNSYTGTTPAVTFQIERSVNGGAYALVADDVASSPWTDSSPGAGTNQYRVLAEIESLSLASAFATGNTVSTLAPPLAPTFLAPNGVNLDLALPVVLQWQHNHGGDGAAQTHFTIQYSTNGGSTWTTLANDVASATSSYTVAGGTLANGSTYQWRVKTEGVVSAGYGPYSLAATIIGSSTPVVNITVPGATTTSLPLTVIWTYAQAQGSPQNQWTAFLYDAGLNQLEVKNGVGTTLTTTFAYLVQDTETYTVRVQSRSAAGLYSNMDSQTTVIDLPSPAPIDTVAEYQPCTGTVVLHLTPQAPEGGEVAAISATIERRINGGEWVVLVSEVPVPSDFVDPLPITNGLNEYRVTSISATPSYFTNTVVEVIGTDGGQDSGLWIFLSHGSGFAQVLRVHGNPATSSKTSRVRASQVFLGRRKPVLLVGENRGRAISFSGELDYGGYDCIPVGDCVLDSPPVGWEDLSQEAEVVCYRDYTGRRIFGMLGDMDVADVFWPKKASVSFSVIEDDYTEAYVTVGD